MNQGYFIQYGLELLDDSSNYTKEHFEKISDILLSLYISRIDRKETNFKGERSHYINLITQKFLLHIHSIKTLIDGIDLNSNIKNFKTKVKDPFSINVLVRGSIENYLVLNYISNRFEDENLLLCRFDIWMRHGIRKRGVEPESEEEKRVHEIDENSIEVLTNRIKEQPYYLNLSEQKREKFIKQINSDWKVKFKDDKFFPATWKDLIYLSGFKKELGQNMYNYLSWHVHTSSISIIQLKNMWDDDFHEFSIKVALAKINIFTSFLISDIVHSDQEFKNAFNSLSEDSRELVSFYNYANREEKYNVKE